jgi:hypothetical protein
MESLSLCFPENRSLSDGTAWFPGEWIIPLYAMVILSELGLHESFFRVGGWGLDSNDGKTKDV